MPALRTDIRSHRQKSTHDDMLARLHTSSPRRTVDQFSGVARSESIGTAFNESPSSTILVEKAKPCMENLESLDINLELRLHAIPIVPPSLHRIHPVL